jgi:hypothetical protein
MLPNVGGKQDRLVRSTTSSLQPLRINADITARTLCLTIQVVRMLIRIYWLLLSAHATAVKASRTDWTRCTCSTAHCTPTEPPNSAADLDKTCSVERRKRIKCEKAVISTLTQNDVLKSCRLASAEKEQLSLFSQKYLVELLDTLSKLSLTGCGSKCRNCCCVICTQSCRSQGDICD